MLEEESLKRSIDDSGHEEFKDWLLEVLDEELMSSPIGHEEFKDWLLEVLDEELMSGPIDDSGHEEFKVWLW